MHAMVLGVAGFQAAQHQAGGVVVRLVHLHHLEAALQRGIALKYCLYSLQVVAAMVRSSPRASAGFSRLAIRAARLVACADNGVRFVNKQQHRLR
jgi:hypothetical protein